MGQLWDATYFVVYCVSKMKIVMLLGTNTGNYAFGLKEW